MKKSVFLLALYLLTACTTDNLEINSIMSWKQLSKFPGTARASASSFVVGDRAYVCLGRTGERAGFLKELWEYNSTMDSWSRKADFPGAARVKGIAGVIADKAYVGLGCVSAYNGNQFNDFWEYDNFKNSWTQKADFPGKGKTDSFCTVVNGCLYTTGGFTATGFNAETYKYDPKLKSWTKMADCPVDYACTAGFTIDNDFYVGSGYNAGNHKDFYCYHTLTDSWSRIADVPEGRILSKGTSINGKGYVMMGRYWHGSLNGGHLLSDVFEYVPLSNKWTRAGDFQGGARQNMVVFTINGKGYVVGGEDDVERKGDVWVFEP